MKKALAILMVLALVASVAVAEVTVGGWGRGIFVPVANSGVSGEDNYSIITKTWWNGTDTNTDGRVKFTVTGSSDNVGFQMNLNADGGNIGNDDALALVWVKPMDMVKVTMGRYFDDTLRGNTAFGSFNWLRVYGGDQGEDITFTRISSSSDNKNWQTDEGFLVTVTPNEAMFFAVNFADVEGLTSDLFSKIQVQAGYTIDGLGQIRAQYFSELLGGAPEADADGTIELAFKFTKIENLYVDFGFRMFTNADGKAADDEMDFSLYAKYGMDAFTFHGLVIYKLLDDAQFNIAAGVDYDLGDGIGIEADVRYYNDFWNKAGDGEPTITFFAGVKKGFSNGLIGAGVTVQSSDVTAWAIPVRMEYWF